MVSSAPLNPAVVAPCPLRPAALCVSAAAATAALRSATAALSLLLPWPPPASSPASLPTLSRPWLPRHVHVDRRAGWAGSLRARLDVGSIGVL